MAKMNYDKGEQVRLKADFLWLILGCSLERMRKSLAVEFVETYIPLIGSDSTQFMNLIQSEQQYVEVEKMVTVYEQIALEQ